MVIVMLLWLLFLLSQAYQQYQDTRFSSNFIEDFGVEDEMSHSPLPYAAVYTNLTTLNCTVAADEEQTQSMAAFEAAFAERVQVFNDSESDEEVRVCLDYIAVGNSL